MLLKKLTLYNFRQFYGENRIDFAWGEETNVTLIHGENGVGKTTILNSILWCLFEKLNEDFERSDDLINSESIKEGRTSCRVELLFGHEGVDYLAQRHYSNNSKPSFKVYKVEGHNFQELPLPDQFISSILPPQMANYFFFHGEGISTISDRRSGETFRRAIRDILGFTFAEHAVEDLRKIKRNYGKKAEEIHKKNEQARKAASAKGEAEERVNELEAAITNVEGHLKDEEERYERLRQELSNSGNSDASRIERELKAATQRISRTERELREIHVERQALISKYGWAVFGEELAQKGLDFIDESTLKGRIPSPYQESFVNDLLQARECICGRELEAGTSEYEAVASLLETANTALISQRVMKARSAASNMAGYAREFLEEVRRIEAKREELETRLRVEQEEEKKLEEDLRGIDEEEIKRLTKAFDASRKKRDELLVDKTRLSKDLEASKAELETQKRELSKHGGDNEQIIKLGRYEEIIENMIERCQGRLQEVEEGAKRIIAQTVNSILTRFSRKDYSIRVNETFEFYLVRDDGEIVAKSKGENLLLNLAFVASLIDMAQKREKAAGDFLVQGTVAPFVIDAPFGELDETYKGATAAFLPSTAKQVVLLLSSSHWQGTVDQAIKPFVGSEYVLVSERRSEKGNKPEDVIRIGEKEIKQSVYSAERDVTSVEKVV